MDSGNPPHNSPYTWGRVVHLSPFRRVGKEGSPESGGGLPEAAQPSVGEEGWGPSVPLLIFQFRRGNGAKKRQIGTASQPRDSGQIIAAPSLGFPFWNVE